jgi:hypothetical protein
LWKIEEILLYYKIQTAYCTDVCLPLPAMLLNLICRLLLKFFNLIG